VMGTDRGPRRPPRGTREAPVDLTEWARARGTIPLEGVRVLDYGDKDHVIEERPCEHCHGTGVKRLPRERGTV
jgi:hypothetical protein